MSYILLHPVVFIRVCTEKYTHSHTVDYESSCFLIVITGYSLTTGALLITHMKKN